MKKRKKERKKERTTLDCITELVSELIIPITNVTELILDSKLYSISTSKITPNVI